MTDIAPLLLIGVWSGAFAGLLIGCMNAAVLTVAFIGSRRLPCPLGRYHPILGFAGAFTSGLGLWGVHHVGLPQMLLAQGAVERLLAFASAGVGGWWVGTRVTNWLVRATTEAEDRE